MEEGLADADAVVFMNNHKSYSEVDIGKLASTMNHPSVVLDGWHLFKPEDLNKIHGVTYKRLGSG